MRNIVTREFKALINYFSVRLFEKNTGSLLTKLNIFFSLFKILCMKCGSLDTIVFGEGCF